MHIKTISAITAAAIILVAAIVIPTTAPAFSQTNNSSISGEKGSVVKKTLKIGYFPNINHAQAVIGLGNGNISERFRRQC